jgi:hypothetical protein
LIKSGSQLGSHRHGRREQNANGHGPPRRPGPLVRTGLDVVGQLMGAYGSEGWGFESLRARPGQQPFALLAAALLLTDLLTPAPSPAGIEPAKMSAAAAT